MGTVEQTIHEAPGKAGSPVELKERYDNFIGGHRVPPTTESRAGDLTRGGRVDPRWKQGLRDGPADQGRPRVDQLLGLLLRP